MSSMLPQPSKPHTDPRRPWGCGGCDRRWTSLTQAHCQLCHEQFASVGMADKHHTYDGRRKPTCLPPAQVKTKGGQRVFRLAEGADGPVWRSFARREDV